MAYGNEPCQCGFPFSGCLVICLKESERPIWLTNKSAWMQYWHIPSVLKRKDLLTCILPLLDFVLFLKIWTLFYYCKNKDMNNDQRNHLIKIILELSKLSYCQYCAGKQECVIFHFSHMEILQSLLYNGVFKLQTGYDKLKIENLHNMFYYSSPS